ncbi:MAG: M16 family metallopeptidase [Gemmatimonadota bacterium]
MRRGGLARRAGRLGCGGRPGRGGRGAFGWRLAGAALLALGVGGCALPGLGGGASEAGPADPEAAARARAERMADSLLSRKGPPVGRKAIEALEFAPLRFEPPEPTRFQLSNGVTVFFLRDRAFPLVDLFIDVKGGYLYLDRSQYAAAAALLPMMRNGGTASLPPDSVDGVIEFNALGLSTASNGAQLRLGISALADQLDLALDLWSDILLHPRFDPDALERWRRREIEAVRRLPDLPGSLAVMEFNRLMYGEHPTGWRMAEEDLVVDRVDRDRLLELHARMVCPDHAVVGAAGDISVDALREKLERVLGDWEPCGTDLVEPDPPTLRADPTVYVIHRPIPQTTVVVGQPGGVLMEESEDYFASRVANWLLGGSGFTSRLMQRLRTQEGLAYSASSIWGTAREHERILGAITHTRSESTVEAARLLLDTFREARASPPGAGDIAMARDAIANGFVFGFSSPIQIVARQVSYLLDGLPGDWLDRYLRGIRAVDEAAVARVLRQTIDTSRFTIVVVGDTTLFDPTQLGVVEYLSARR